MPTIFFSYYLRNLAAAEEFERQILRDVAPRARAEESVESWALHRTTSWPGGSQDAPDYICVVDVADLELWSLDASASIFETHGALGPLVRRIAMAVTADVVEGGVAKSNVG